MVLLIKLVIFGVIVLVGLCWLVGMVKGTLKRDGWDRDERGIIIYPRLDLIKPRYSQMCGRAKRNIKETLKRD